jgi:glycosyltransferase involved in cell wall biosynthesis
MGRLLRILLTCHRDPFSYIGGSEEAVKSMALEFAKLGHKVTVVTKKEPHVPYQAIYDTEGKPLHFYSGQVKHVEVIAAFEPLGTGPFVTNNQLSHFLGYCGWDAVILYGQNVWLTDEIWRDVGGRWHDGVSTAKIVYLPIGFLSLERPSSRWMWPYHFLYHHIIQDHLIEQSDITVALTDHEVEQIPRFGRAKRLVKIPNGVDYSRFQDNSNDSHVRDRFQLPDGPLILNVGGNYSNKHVEDACRGVGKLNQFMPKKSTLVLVGPDTKRFNNGFVRGLGEVSEADKVALYHEASVLLHTSDFEGFGLVYLEALASGLPFASTAVGAEPELSRMFGGHTIFTRTPDGIAYSLMSELEEERDQGQLRAIAARYDWTKIVQQFMDVLS